MQYTAQFGEWVAEGSIGWFRWMNRRSHVFTCRRVWIPERRQLAWEIANVSLRWWALVSAPEALYWSHMVAPDEWGTVYLVTGNRTVPLAEQSRIAS